MGRTRKWDNDAARARAHRFRNGRGVLNRWRDATGTLVEVADLWEDDDEQAIRDALAPLIGRLNDRRRAQDVDATGDNP